MRAVEVGNLVNVSGMGGSGRLAVRVGLDPLVAAPRGGGVAKREQPLCVLVCVRVGDGGGAAQAGHARRDEVLLVFGQKVAGFRVVSLFPLLQSFVLLL